MSNPKNVLVVGGTGRLGGFIIDAILAKDPKVHIRVLGRTKDEQLYGKMLTWDTSLAFYV